MSKTEIKRLITLNLVFFTDTSVVTKYCIKTRQLARPEGCYTTEADAGYIRQCFCYSDWCNAAPTLTSYTLLPVSLFIAVWVLLR